MGSEICYIIDWGIHIIAMGLITTRVARAETVANLKANLHSLVLVLCAGIIYV